MFHFNNNNIIRNKIKGAFAFFDESGKSQVKLYNQNHRGKSSAVKEEFNVHIHDTRNMGMVNTYISEHSYVVTQE